MDLSHIGRLLIVAGGLIVAVGVLLLALNRLPWIGRLPGDFVLRKGRLTVYLPLATSLLLSLLLTLILRFWSRH